MQISCWPPIWYWLQDTISFLLIGSMKLSSRHSLSTLQRCYFYMYLFFFKFNYTNLIPGAIWINNWTILDKWIKLLDLIHKISYFWIISWFKFNLSRFWFILMHPWFLKYKWKKHGFSKFVLILQLFCLNIFFKRFVN